MGISALKPKSAVLAAVAEAMTTSADAFAKVRTRDAIKMVNAVHLTATMDAVPTMVEYPHLQRQLDRPHPQRHHQPLAMVMLMEWDAMV